MKITIESTVSEPSYTCKATVEVGYDDVGVHEIMRFFRQAMVGYGYVLQGEDEGEDT